MIFKQPTWDAYVGCDPLAGNSHPQSAYGDYIRTFVTIEQRDCGTNPGAGADLKRLVAYHRAERR